MTCSTKGARRVTRPAGPLPLAGDSPPGYQGTAFTVASGHCTDVPASFNDQASSLQLDRRHRSTRPASPSSLR